jgi:hypothetical protein
VAIHHSRFIYECLLDLPVSIRRGNVVTELLCFAKEQGATRIATTSACKPGFLHICRQLQANGLTLEIYEDLPRSSTESVQPFDLKMFSRFWQQA